MLEHESKSSKSREDTEKRVYHQLSSYRVERDRFRSCTDTVGGSIVCYFRSCLLRIMAMCDDSGFRHTRHVPLAHTLARAYL